MTKSVYIHIPFCQNICSYCNFTKFFYHEESINKYLNILEKEILSNYQNEVIETLYIGGGSPSSLNILMLKKLFKIIKIFKLSSNLEFTIEVNPSEIDLEKLKLFKQNGVNRISVGVQSTLDKNIKYLNRNHNYQTVKNCIKLIKSNGISNINIDLIYGLPNQTIKDLEKDLNNILKLDITHISTYSLIIEEHTKLYIQKEKNISEDLDYLMYQHIISKLTNNGFKHYEISNFSKENYMSKHNLVYWNNSKYYGFGLSASGYLNNYRYTNTKNLNKYLNLNYCDELEYLEQKDIISYALILGFRKINGINKEEFKRKYNIDILSLYNINDLIKQGYIIDDGCNIKISYDKIYIENSILINFID